MYVCICYPCIAETNPSWSDVSLALLPWSHIDKDSKTSKKGKGKISKSVESLLRRREPQLRSQTISRVSSRGVQIINVQSSSRITITRRHSLETKLVISSSSIPHILHQQLRVAIASSIALHPIGRAGCIVGAPV